MSGPRSRPLGVVTRGTTHPNRLRRVDRWVAATLGGLLRAAELPPVVVDLGYGASPVTAVELRERLAQVRADVEVVGLEIDPARVSAAQPYAAEPGLRFALGGFELPVPQGRPALVVRAFNVLRQYPKESVPDAWAQVVARLSPGGVLVEGTCDELGRLASWVDVVAVPDGPPTPRALTLSWHLRGLERPSVVAERLPKVLIHHNVPGQPVHRLMADLDRAWSRAAPQAAFGTRQRFLVTAAELRDRGWPVLGGPARWRLGELAVAWPAVAPQRE